MTLVTGVTGHPKTVTGAKCPEVMDVTAVTGVTVYRDIYTYFFNLNTLLHLNYISLSHTRSVTFVTLTQSLFINLFRVTGALMMPVTACHSVLP